MPTSADTVALILRSELATLSSSLKEDTEANFLRKRHNFLLASFDADALFYAVFTSSFESKSGNALEACAKQIARLRYGPDSVPAVIQGLGATDEDAAAYAPKQAANKRKVRKTNDADTAAGAPSPPDKQVILTRKKIGEVEKHAVSTLKAHRRSGRGKKVSVSQGLTQDILRRDVLAYSYPDDDTLHDKPVDLYIQPPLSPALCLEVKLGGDLDSSSGPAQLAKLVTLCALTGQPDVQGYFATIYNKDGEGNRFTGVVPSYLSGDMILPGSAFWNTILPEGLSFNDFRQLYAAAWKDAGMNDAIRALVARLVPGSSTLPSEIIKHLTE